MKNNLSFPSPIMTKKAFAACSGLREEQIRGQIARGYLPVKYIGRLVLINVARLTKDCLEESEKSK
ncbi:DNA-binding protein [Hahella aquimaris]|uniref:DNA-binding protein n=1 Tax=Hahella sp. HNIBRBA332 TaxID=3015983 RepID=UPI00273C76D9|nr:DNA-binding protein [Hahella sp. HNIBRBA332]WLQ14421.1 DNA-binding protein [Hahella sp. HNIBRBA332]